MHTSYTDKDLKWFQAYDKNIDTALKTIKKLKEDLATKPELMPTTSDKYRLYVSLLINEAVELQEMYMEMEGHFQGEAHSDEEPVPYVTQATS